MLHRFGIVEKRFIGGAGVHAAVLHAEIVQGLIYMIIIPDAAVILQAIKIIKYNIRVILKVFSRDITRERGDYENITTGLANRLPY